MWLKTNVFDTTPTLKVFGFNSISHYRRHNHHHNSDSNKHEDNHAWCRNRSRSKCLPMMATNDQCHSLMLPSNIDVNRPSIKHLWNNFIHRTLVSSTLFAQMANILVIIILCFFLLIQPLEAVIEERGRCCIEFFFSNFLEIYRWKAEFLFEYLAPVRWILPNRI